MILRAKKRVQSHLKINNRHGMVMFVSMNAVNNSELQPSNKIVQNRKLPSSR